MPIKLVVGLGNPGPEYEQTRHNAGARLVEALAHDCHAQLTPESKFSGLTARITLNHRDVRLLVPTTYMNLSGQAVAPMANFFKIELDEILVVHDEIDLPPGTAKLKKGGGAGGNNGLKDIIKAMGNQNEFYRLRIGVGHPGNKAQVANYVLAKPPANERELIEDSITRALRVLPEAITGDWDKATRELHTESK